MDVSENTLVMPKLGLTMTEGTLVEWKVSPGQSFAAGQALLVVETEKIANDVEATCAGVMTVHLVAAGDTVPVGTPIARWSGGGNSTRTSPDSRVESPPSSIEPPPQRADAAPAKCAPSGERIIATPLARKQAVKLGVELRDVAGSGPLGRIRAADVRAAASGVSSSASAPVASQLCTVLDKRPLMELREQISSIPSTQNVTLLDLVGLAAARVIEAIPQLNRTWSSEEGAQLAGGNVCVEGTSGPKFVPHANRMRLAEFIRSAAAVPCDAAVRVQVSRTAFVGTPPHGIGTSFPLTLSLSSPDTQLPYVALSVTYDSHLFNDASIKVFLEELMRYFEQPLRILLD